MFCPKCGGSNPDNGKFCRACGTDLSPVAMALKAKDIQKNISCSTDNKDATLQGSVTKIFMGVAFMIIAFILGWTGMAGGKSWWFWMLIPAFGMMGTGVANYLQFRRNEASQLAGPAVGVNELGNSTLNALPDRSPQFAEAGSRYNTGDLVPPSVTDNTTRHLEVNSEGQTMTLPKK
jgi:hypothetical protein